MPDSRNRLFAKLAKDLDTDGNITQSGLAAGVGGGSGGLDSAAVTSLIDSDYVVERTTGAIIAYNTILSGDD